MTFFFLHFRLVSLVKFTFMIKYCFSLSSSMRPDIFCSRHAEDISPGGTHSNVHPSDILTRQISSCGGFQQTRRQSASGGPVGVLYLRKLTTGLWKRNRIRMNMLHTLGLSSFHKKKCNAKKNEVEVLENRILCLMNDCNISPAFLCVHLRSQPFEENIASGL